MQNVPKLITLTLIGKLKSREVWRTIKNMITNNNNHSIVDWFCIKNMKILTKLLCRTLSAIRLENIELCSFTPAGRKEDMEYIYVIFIDLCI